MKKNLKRIISVIISLVMLMSVCSVSAGAFTVADNSVFAGIDAENGKPDENFMKLFYNTLSLMAERLAKFICTVYPDNVNWEKFQNYRGIADGFMPGRQGYVKEETDGSCWKLGYADRSVIPDDVENGKYNIGRFLTNLYAKGVYDDQKVRISVIDDNSGRGAVIVGDIDAMGITSADVREIRKGILKYAEETDFRIASINISATHAHSVLDVQGISTDFVYKLFFSKYNNMSGMPDKSGRLYYAEKFRQNFISKAVECAIAAIADMEDGELFYSAVDTTHYTRDKRGLIKNEDIQKTPVLCFRPYSGTEKTYIAAISCHPTTFNARHELIGSDFIYYMEEYIRDNDGGANTIMIPGVLGQVGYDNITSETEGLTEWELKGARVKEIGRTFGRCILSSEKWEKLSPFMNVTHREIFIKPENSVLALACEIGLVNNKVYKDSINSFILPTEMGYLEFGGRVALALFPAELYPEVFLGDDIAGNPTWDGKSWQFGSLADAVSGVDIYASSLANDSLGYVLTDNNFAFMGHILGDNIADETLSCGKHTGSYLVTEYYAMINGFVK